MTRLGRGERRNNPTTFLDRQQSYFSTADPDHYHWRTTDAYLSEKESDLLRMAAINPRERLLEIGCGEGANLYWLSPNARSAVGLDLSQAKVTFAKGRVPRARFLCADATRLPIRAGCADVAICRDTLHHVHDQAAVVAEMTRVVRPGGRLVIIEPNGRNPVVLLQAALIPEERGVLRSTVGSLQSILRGLPLEGARFSRTDPLPVGRALFHYKFGFPSLSARLGRAMRSAEKLMGRVLPRAMWGYIVLIANRSR